MTRSLLSVFVPSVVQRRIAAKFVVSFVLVLIAIAAVGAIGYADVNDTIEQETSDDLESEATMQADALSEWAKRMTAQAEAVSRHQDVNGADDEQVETALHVAVARGDARDASALHVVDTGRNRVVASSGSDAIDQGTPLRELDQPWAVDDLEERAARDNVWISEDSYESQAVQGRTVVAFAVTAPHPERVVVLEGAIDVRVGQLHQGETNQTTAIVNRNGDYVLHPEGDNDGVLEDAAVRGEVDDALATGDVQFHRDDERLYAVAPVTGVTPENQFVAVSSTPRSDAYAVRDAVGQNVVYVVLVALLALALVGVVLGHQTVTPLERLRNRTEAMEAGDLDVNLETDRTDEIGQLYGAFDRMRRSLRQQIEDARAARDEAQAERERVRRINESLERRAAAYSDVMERAAGGDLTARMETDVENDAMAAIAEDFNDMLAALERTVAELTAFATEVATASEEVTASSEEVRSASEQISESVQEISAGAERQHDSLQAVDAEIADLSTTTQQIAAASNQVADIAERTATTGERGRDAAQAAIEGMASVQDGSERAVEEIVELESEVAQIDELIERIQEIADQTNMLALNANIEASRSAGSEGDAGFGVVAQEVKELSEDVKDTASEVEGRLERIREQTRVSADEVQQTSVDVDDAGERVAEAVDALEEIASFANETHAGVQDISAATEQQAASTEQVVAMVDHATGISQETTAESENVAAAAEEQTSALSAVSQSASDLSEQAARLSEALDRFDTDAAPDDRTAAELFERTRDGPTPSVARTGASSSPGSDASDPVDVDPFDPGVDAADFGADSSTDETAGDDGGRTRQAAGEPDDESGVERDASSDDERRANDATPDGEERAGRRSSERPSASSRTSEQSTAPSGRGGTASRGTADGTSVEPTDRTGADVLGGDHGDGRTVGVTREDAANDASSAADAAVGAAPERDGRDPTEREDSGDESDDAANDGAVGRAEQSDDGETPGAADRETSGAADRGTSRAADRGTSRAADRGTSRAADDGDEPAATPDDDGADTAADADLTDLYGVGTATAEALRDAGFETVADVREASLEDLARVEGIGEVRATEIKSDVEE